MTTEKQNELLNYLSDDETRKLAGENLLNNYKASIDALEKSKKSQQQAADIAMRKMQKYLPQQLKAQGLHGLGISETAQIDAQNQYVSQMGQIAQAHDAQRAAVENDFNQNLLSLYEAHKGEKKEIGKDNYNVALDTIENWAGSADELAEYVSTLDRDDVGGEGYYNALINAYKTKESSSYQEILNVAEGFDDPGERYEYLRSVKDKIPDAYKEDFNLYMHETGVEKFQQSKIYIPETEYISAVDNGRELRIKVDGTEYTVGKGSVADEDIISFAGNSSKVKNDSIFEYEGEIYYKDASGIYKVTKGDLNDWNYQDLKKKIKAMKEEDK